MLKILIYYLIFCLNQMNLFLLKSRPTISVVENLVENDMDYGGPNATTVTAGMKLGFAFFSFSFK